MASQRKKYSKPTLIECCIDKCVILLSSSKPPIDDEEENWHIRGGNSDGRVFGNASVLPTSGTPFEAKFPLHL